MRKIAIIICICLLTISVGLLDVHNGNLDGFLLMLVGITCFVSAVVPPITFYLHVILPCKKIAGSIHKADEKFIKTIYNEGIDIYIDDEPVSNNFNVKGTNLLDYSFKVKDKKIYFISKK